MGTRKEIYTEKKFTLAQRKTARTYFIKLILCFTFPAVVKTKLPVDPFMAFMNAFGYTFGRICFVWREIARTVNSQGFILKTKHLLRSTQPFSTLKIFFGFKRDDKNPP